MITPCSLRSNFFRNSVSLTLLSRTAQTSANKRIICSVLTILAWFAAAVLPIAAQTLTWSETILSADWSAIASSADGRKLIAAANNGRLYTSADGGISWIPREATRSWTSVASSYDGNVLAATDFGGRIYVSDDAGATWTPRESSRSWNAVAMSADGRTIYAGGVNLNVYKSVDFGVSWTPDVLGFLYLAESIAVSADGQTVAVAGEIPNSTVCSTGIQVSDNGAGTWRLAYCANAPTRFQGVAMSRDGRTIVGAALNSRILLSNDAGQTWSERDNFGNWTAAASSANGKKLFAVEYGAGFSDSRIFESLDSGSNWALATPTFLGEFASVTSSGNGNRVAVASVGSGIDRGVRQSCFSPGPLSTGALDLTFNCDGKVAEHFFAGQSNAQDVLIDGNGKILIVGWNARPPHNLGLKRFETDGTQDDLFGAYGSVEMTINGDFKGPSIAIQPDQKFVVSGIDDASGKVYLARFESSGSLDHTFGSNGIIRTSPLGATGTGVKTSVEVQPDGFIVVASTCRTGTNRELCVLRFDSDGNPDTSFGTNGLVTTPVGSGDAFGNSLVLEASGKITVSGRSANSTDAQDEFAVVRYLSDGSLDSSFGTGGIATFPVGDRSGDDGAEAIALYPGGMYVIAGYAANGVSGDDFAVIRLDSNGVLDGAFDTDGKALIPFSANNDGASGIAVQPNGMIVVTGTNFNGANNDFAAIRLDSTGVLDPQFGTGGKVSIDFAGDDDVSNASLIDTQARVVMVGETFDANSTGRQFGIARLANLFGAAPVATADFHSTSEDVQLTIATPGVLDNDYDSNGDMITAVLDSTPQHAANFSFNTDGSFVYTPLPNFAGTDSFTYHANDGTSDSPPATVTINVGSVNDAPVGIADFYAMPKNRILNIPPSGVLRNDSDADGDGLTAIVQTPPSNSSNFVLNPDGSFTYEPILNFLGTDSFTYFATDGTTLSAPISVTIDVRDCTNPPVTSPGDLDTTFDCDGRAFSNGSSTNWTTAGKMAVQQDGKIVVVGGRYDQNLSTWTGFRVVRFSPDGRLDPTFDVDGEVVTEIGNVSTSATAVTIQPDGKIVVVGGSNIEPGRPSAIVIRYLPNGQLDGSFGTAGIATFLPQNSFFDARDVAIHPDQGIVVVGRVPNPQTINNANDFAILKFTSSGVLDNTFDGDGFVQTEVSTYNDEAESVLIQPDGRIVVGGKSGLPFGSPAPSNFFSLVRLTANGALDATFGSGGKVITQIGTSEAQGKDLAFGPNGSIVMTGNIFNFNNLPYLVGAVRYDSSGALDPTFDGDGIATTSVVDYNLATSVVVQQDGSVIVSGHTPRDLTFSDFLAIRYTPAGQLDTTWGSGGVAFIDFASGMDFVTDSAIDSNGRLLLGGQASLTGIPVSPTIGVARLLNNGTVNTAPVAGNNSYSTFRNTRVDIAPQGVLGNDSDLENDPLTTTLVAGPQHADTFTFNSNGSFSYRPATGFAGVDSFTYLANDGRANSNAATVSITVIGSPNPLDSTFGGSGKVTTSFGPGVATGRAIVVQPDGKFVVAGYYAAPAYVIAVARYNTDGSLDTTFDGDGLVTTGVSGSIARGFGVAVVSGGKIIVSGVSNGFTSNFVTVRYNSNGSPDATYGTGGIASTPDVGAYDPVGLAIQADGKAVVAGPCYDGQYKFCLARFNTDGSMDTSFDSDGIVRTAIGPAWSYAEALAIQPADQKIVVAGRIRNAVDGWDDIAVARYNVDGSLDSSFDGDGMLTTPVSPTGFASASDYARAVAVRADGRIVVVGDAGSNRDFVVIRYNSDGSLDSSFDGDGVVTTSFGANTFDQAYSVLLLPGNKIIASGSSDDGTGADFAFARYNSDGSLDATFTNGLLAPFAYGDGKITIDLEGGTDRVYGLALDGSGGILTAGGSGTSFGLLRLPAFTPTAAEVSVSGAVRDSSGAAVRNALVELTDSRGVVRSMRTGTFGNFGFSGIEAEQVVTISASAKGMTFQPAVIQVNDNVGGIVIQAVPTGKTRGGRRK